jgi:uncharacterized protein (DUF1499 family)
VHESPLPPCPDTPNCEHVTRRFGTPPDALFSAAQSAIDAMGPSSLNVDASRRRLEAVFTVVLIFKDDVDLAVEPHDDGSVLHIRSASRVGVEDFGVNRRRVERFFDALDAHLQPVAEKRP